MKLEKCPFCGGESKYYKRYIGYGSLGLGEHDWFSVKCEKCRAKSDEYKTEAEAIAAWNRRTGKDINVTTNNAVPVTTYAGLAVEALREKQERDKG
jgi:Lar family restriction alleviation protein